MDPLMAYKSTSDPNTMYLHEPTKKPDSNQIIKAVQK